MVRPREYDREFIFKRLQAWAKEPTSLNINAFCSLPDVCISFDKLWAWCNQNEQFHEVYKEAKAFISINREEANSCDELSDAAYNKHLHVYDSAYKLANREEKLFDHDLNKDFEKFKKSLEKLSQAGDEEAYNKKFNDLLDQLKSLTLSNANIDCNNTSNDTKS